MCQPSSLCRISKQACGCTGARAHASHRHSGACTRTPHCLIPQRGCACVHAGINIFAASSDERTGYALAAQLAETAVSLLLIRRLTQGSVQDAGGAEALGLFK